MNARRDVRDDDRALKTLFRELVRLVGGVEAAASCTRVGKSQLASYYDMTCDMFAPIDVVVALEVVAGEPLITAEMARRSGLEVSRREGAAARAVPGAVARLARETGDVIQALGEGLSDGHLCAEDLARIEREAQEAHLAVDATLDAVRAARQDAQP